MSEITLYAQADVVDVRLELRPTTSAAELERLVMRAIAAGVDDYNTLSLHFGLTPRLMADLLGDLWTAGRVTLDLGTTPETISLSAEGLAYLAEASSDDATRLSSTTSRVLLERLTGRVLGDRAGQRSVDRRYVIPVMRDDRLPRQVSTIELTEGVRQNLERGDHELEFIDDQRIVSVLPVMRPSEVGAARLMVPIRAAVWRDGDVIHVNVTDRELTLDARERASRRLESYLRENSETSFARALRGAAQLVADRVRTSDDILAELASGVRDLASTDAGVRQSTHDRLEHLAHQLADQAGSLADREMTVDLVVDDDHEAVLDDLIRQAQQQVVIAVPRISLARLTRHQTALEEAVARGVRVFVIWGLDGSGVTLGDHLTQFFYAISRRGAGGGAIRFAAASAHSHAKVVIADDRRALVTSKNFLSNSDLGEIGVLATADEHRPSPVIEELLAWAGQTMPDYQLAQQILRSADEFGVRDAPVPQRRPTIPRYDPELGEAPVGDPRVDLWAAAWATTESELRAALVRTRPVVRPLRDGRHHTLLRELLQEAQHRMVVASHRIAVPVIARDLASRAGHAQHRGASVELVYGELDARTERIELDEVIEQDTSGAVRLRERQHNHAKVLVADDIAVVGSFNYLSFSGISRRGMSSEVSLEIVSAEFADRVAQALGSELRMPPRPPAPAVDGAGSAVLATARELALDLSAARIDIDGVVAALAEDDIDAVLEAFAAAGDGASRELTLAALVASGLDRGRPSWIAELADLAAERGDWMLADLFRRALDEDRPELPPPLLTQAVASEPGMLDAFAAELPDDLPDTDPLALHLAAEMLLGGELLDAALARRRDRMSNPVGAVVDAIREHTRRYSWVDRDALRAHHLRSTADENRDAAWVALDDAITRLRDVDVRVLAGRNTIDHVFAEGAEFDVVQTIAADRDADALADWLAAHESDDFAWVDQSAKAAKAPPIVGGLRERFASRRGRVRAAARDIVLAVRSDVPYGRQLGEGELASLRAIADMVADLVPSSATRFGAALGARARDRLARAADPDLPPVGLAPWRLPRVPGGGDPDGRATLAARDLFEVRTIADAVTVLTTQQDLTPAADLVAELAASGAVSDSEASRLERAIEAERDRRIQITSDRIVSLLARAEVLDVDAPHAERARRDGFAVGPALDALLDEEDLTLELLEQQQRAELEQLLAALPEHEVTRREQVGLLLESGEFVAARVALTTRGGGEGRNVVPPTFRWPGWSLADVCRNLVAPDERPPGFEQFVPTDDDESGWRVVSALQGLWKQEPGAVAEYLAAVQALIDPDAEAPLIEAGLGDETAEFSFPPAPYMRWGLDPVTVAIGRSEAPALIRIALTMERDLDGAVLHIADVLSLLRAPDPITRWDDRRTGFLRIVASQLPVDRLFGPETIGVDAAPPTTATVSRLLHLLGVDLDRPDRYALQAMLGAHPFVFWKVVEWVRNHADGRVRLSELRADPAFDRVVVRMIARDLATEPALAVLGTLAEFGERTGADADDLAALLRSEAEEAIGSPLPAGMELVDLDAVLERLVAQRYVELTADGAYRVKPEGAYYAIRRTYRQGWHTAALQATVRLARSAFQQHLDADLRRHLLHHWRGQAVEAGVGDERRVLAGIDELGDPDVPVNVQNVMRVVSRTYEGPPEIYLGTGMPENANVTVSGPYVYLAVVLSDAIRNAWQAIRARGMAEGRHEYVRLDAEVLEREVVFRITDSGPGFDDATLAAFEAGTSVRSRHGADAGQGLSGYLSFSRYWGTVTLANHPVRGGLVTVRVTRLDDRPPRTDVDDAD